MEEWTTAESALFEEAMEKYGKGTGNKNIECGGYGSS
jgi:hypothetical protein